MFDIFKKKKEKTPSELLKDLEDAYLALPELKDRTPSDLSMQRLSAIYGILRHKINEDPSSLTEDELKTFDKIGGAKGFDVSTPFF